MKGSTISSGGQVSIPAEVRHRWRTRRILIDDRGDELVIRPIPDDPIRAAIGSLAGTGPSTDEMRAALRQEEAEIEDRRWEPRR
jgi:bifunctional DNA-binding transcriptional regulator/antitoxin component of YhaV-PrlF toxin-antitoxin module